MSAPFVVRPRDRGAGEHAVTQATDAAAAASVESGARAATANAPWVPASRGPGRDSRERAEPRALPVREERHPVLTPFETYLDDPEVMKGAWRQL